MTSEDRKSVLEVIGLLTFVAVLCIGGWFLYWNLFRSATHRTAQIIRHNYEAQQTYRDEVERQIANVRTVDTQIAIEKDQAIRQALQAQRAAMVTQLCAIARRVDGGFQGPTASFITIECNPTNGSQP